MPRNNRPCGWIETLLYASWMSILASRLPLPFLKDIVFNFIHLGVCQWTESRIDSWYFINTLACHVVIKVQGSTSFFLSVIGNCHFNKLFAIWVSDEWTYMHGQLILWTAKTHYSNHISIQTLSFALQAISQEHRNNFIYITKHDVMFVWTLGIYGSESIVLIIINLFGDARLKCVNSGTYIEHAHKVMYLRT